jgi:hypothetical protein
MSYQHFPEQVINLKPISLPKGYHGKTVYQTNHHYEHKMYQQRNTCNKCIITMQAIFFFKEQEACKQL